MSRFNLKIIAIVLQLAFTQKLGLGLYLHNWLHTGRSYQGQNTTGPSLDRFQINCTCIDDALMPLVPSTSFELSPPIEYNYTFLSIYHPHVSSSAKIFYALRGPPAQISWINILWF